MEHLYSMNEEKLMHLRNLKPWMQDPKYFKKVKISPSASIKMAMHGQQGVEKGIKLNGKPVEVMGLLLGRPDTEDPTSLIISDAQALPIEGFETKVIADDENVINYMIELGDALEITRKERFCGWYHTHPFDVDVNGHCFLSNTDVATQLQWQRSEDPHGNPWLAIVIDPLYSLAKNRPEMAAFRVYPPEFIAPVNETPDGTIVTNDRNRVELWGACWNRYYKLDIEYYMSALSQQTLGVLKNKFLWQNPFCTGGQEDGQFQSLVNEVRCTSNSLVLPTRRNLSMVYTSGAPENFTVPAYPDSSFVSSHPEACTMQGASVPETDGMDDTSKATHFAKVNLAQDILTYVYGFAKINIQEHFCLGHREKDPRYG
jgi:COP9 signalosome complex subunit 5